MPVFTRSQIHPDLEASSTDYPHDREDATVNRASGQRSSLLHHGLKEKMKALTLLYEQQKQALANRNSNYPPRPTSSKEDLPPLPPPPQQQQQTRFTDHSSQPSYRESDIGILKENNTNTSIKPTVSKIYAMTQVKDMNLMCPSRRTLTESKVVARKLSIGPENEIEETVTEKKGQVVQIQGRIHVFVRLRPMSKKEKEAGARSCVKIVNMRDVYLTEFANENDYLRLKRVRGRHFTFDASFPDSTSQQQVYAASTSELVDAVLHGRNGSVFCYGATGAGKTYTMLGTMENPGVMVLAIKELFSKIREMSFDGDHVVHLSYLEVYNETVRDLLSPGRALLLREDKQGMIVAAGLTHYRAYTTDEVMALLQQGNRNRTTEPTRANETSSRSHAILQVAVEYRFRDALGNISNREGKLSLVDLAGSERALATDQRTLRSLEGANINKSLLALSSCINALAADDSKKHIPFRNSKLTQLLKDSLGGACNTVMIANVSPSNLSFGETQNTLHWADRAKEIRTKDCDVNETVEEETDQAKVVLSLQKENRELRAQLAIQQHKLNTVQASEKPKTRSSSLGNCFTPDKKKKGGGVEEAVMVKELRQTVKALEMEIERLKKDHAVQIKQKDDLIQKQLLKKTEKEYMEEEEGMGKRMATRSSMRLKERAAASRDIKSPSHRFLSPAPVAKKRSFWDITANSPSSTVTPNRRRSRSHVVGGGGAEIPVAVAAVATAARAPSMLLQPGFSRQRKPVPLKK
ncbi:kinesin-like protein KIN-8A [Impatiens glandulifera]|uniref:kinesin-like protein KIN-8A n=1 Tax=Impatiens glandulifera TaxID=253017 RepID=UPI001FB0B0A4|nr:kinesin-like protein KIN-8A [Impatiens glandulifera]